MKKKTNDLPRVGREIQDIVPLRRARSLPCANFSPCHVTSQTAFVGRCLCQRAEKVGQRRPAESTAGRHRRGNIQKPGLRSVRSSVIQVTATTKDLHVEQGKLKELGDTGY